MSYGSEKTEHIKTKRISSSSITNKMKKKLLVEHFVFVKNHKNRISRYIFNHKALLLTAESRKELVAHAKLFNTEQLYSWEVQTIFKQTLDFYENWLDKSTSNNKFFVQKNYLVTYYKKNVSGKTGNILHKKGDVKTKELIEKSTNLTQLMNWLIYVEGSKLDTVLKSLPDDILKKETALKFNNRLQTLRQGKHWNRVKTLILNKRERLLSKMNQPIVYSSGSYAKKPIYQNTMHSYLHVNEDKKHQHWYNFRIGKETIKLPLSYNPSFHGKSDLSEFDITKIHTVKLNSREQINIGLTYNDKKEYFTPLTKNDQIDGKTLCGIDLNVASNFCTIAFHDKEVATDYDRNYITKVVQQLLSYEEKGYKSKSEKQNKELQKLLLGVEFYFKHLISDILKDLISKGITDIVLEDLNLTQCKASFIKDETLNMKYSKLIRLLRLSSIKEWFQQQANNKGIRVHLTTPCYTSQTCSKCQYVDRNNRNKRDFECLNCGHQQDADKNASRNIYARLLVYVLRNSFHKLELGQYVPILMKKENVRIKLTSLYEVDNERQRLNQVFDSETTSFRSW